MEPPPERREEAVVTPRERAEQIVRDCNLMPEDADRIANEIDDAVAAEREACAVIADGFAQAYRSDDETAWADAAEMIRDEIRARSTEGGGG